jgi:hypothetical protein
VHHRNAEWIGESTMSNKLLSRPAGSAATGSLDMVTGLSSNVCRGVAAGTRVGRYRIESYLDRGGMASVYEATDLHLNRRVALKVLVAELADDIEMRERFVRESRFAASLEHPNIVPIYDAGEVEGLLYIAMRRSAVPTWPVSCGPRVRWSRHWR